MSNHKYIKVHNGVVSVAGTVLNQEMLNEGWFLYEKEFPPNCLYEFLRFNDETKEIYEDLELRQSVELKRIEKIRIQKLKESDWMIIKYSELGQPIPENYLNYRTAIRNIKDTYVVGQEIEWPVHPDEILESIDPYPNADPAEEGPVTVEEVYMPEETNVS